MNELVSFFHNSRGLESLTPEQTVTCLSCFMQDEETWTTARCAGISIPDVFRAVNTQKLYPNDSFRPKAFYKGLIGAGKTAPVEECLQCGQCEGACPQHLPIIELLQEAGGRLN
jgi:predicted aldo/keto reductase-like oxidoreductase